MITWTCGRRGSLAARMLSAWMRWPQVRAERGHQWGLATVFGLVRGDAGEAIRTLRALANIDVCRNHRLSQEQQHIHHTHRSLRSHYCGVTYLLQKSHDH